MAYRFRHGIISKETDFNVCAILFSIYFGNLTVISMFEKMLKLVYESWSHSVSFNQSRNWAKNRRPRKCNHPSSGPTESVLSFSDAQVHWRLRFRVVMRVRACLCPRARVCLPILALHSLAIYFFGLTCLFANRRIRMMTSTNHRSILQKRREENPQQLRRDCCEFLASAEE